jgi:hypothetical protein
MNNVGAYLFGFVAGLMPFQTSHQPRGGDRET